MKVFEFVMGSPGAERYWTLLAVSLDVRDCTNDEIDAISYTGRQGWIGVMRIDPSEKDNRMHYAPEHWSDVAGQKMHAWLTENFRSLRSGSTIDYRFHITKEIKVPRLSQRVLAERLRAAKKPLFR